MARVVLIVLIALLAPAPLSRAELAADQRQVAVGYERLESLALRIADAVEADDELRAEQIRAAIGAARASGLNGRFEKVVRLLERERYAAAQNDQTELATQLEELLRLVMADPREARLEEERRRLEELRREVRAALREQRSLRARAKRGEGAELAERQEDLAERVERLNEPAEEADRLAGREAPPENPPGDSSAGESPGAEDPSIAGKLRKGERSMRGASKKLSESQDAVDEQREAQRRLEETQREIEQRLRQLREEEQQRRLATLAERFRRMHESQVGLLDETRSRFEQIEGGHARAGSRSTQLAAAKLADRQARVGSAAEQALRLVRADGSSLVFDDALSQLIDDTRSTERRLREARIDPTTVAMEQLVVDALAEMIAAVDDSLDQMEQRQGASPGASQSGGSGDPSLVSKIAELRMIRSIQARLMRQTEVWRLAAESGDAPRDEVVRRLAKLGAEQARLSRAAAALAPREP